MLTRLFLIAALATPLPAAALNVVTDIPPVQSLAAEVMGTTGTPARLLRPGTSPHDLALRPSDAAALQQADAVFWIGPELSPMLEKAMGTLAANARVVALLDAPATHRLAWRESASLAAGIAPDAAAQGPGGADPHAWLDPANGVAWAKLIAQALSDIDPSNAGLYRTNAAAAAARIEAAAGRARAALSDHPPSFALAHDELQYFGDSFGVRGVAALTDSEAKAPGPRRTAEVLDLLSRERPACIVIGPETAPAAVAPMAQAAGARIVTLDILTAGQPDGRDAIAALYPGLFPALASRLATCHR